MPYGEFPISKSYALQTLVCGNKLLFVSLRNLDSTSKVMDKFVIKRKASELDIDILPDNVEIPQSDINLINQQIITHTVKRCKYASLSKVQKLEVGRYAMQHGNISAFIILA